LNQGRDQWVLATCTAAAPTNVSILPVLIVFLIHRNFFLDSHPRHNQAVPAMSEEASMFGRSFEQLPGPVFGLLCHTQGDHIA
jgi:hypothetical protein